MDSIKSIPRKTVSLDLAGTLFLKVLGRRIDKFSRTLLLPTFKDASHLSLGRQVKTSVSRIRSIKNLALIRGEAVLVL